MILSLLALCIRLVLLALATFAFVVLFEHGPAGYVEGAKTEWVALSETIGRWTGNVQKTPPAGT